MARGGRRGGPRDRHGERVASYQRETISNWTEGRSGFIEEDTTVSPAGTTVSAATLPLRLSEDLRLGTASVHRGARLSKIADSKEANRVKVSAAARLCEGASVPGFLPNWTKPSRSSYSEKGSQSAHAKLLIQWSVQEIRHIAFSFAQRRI